MIEREPNTIDYIGGIPISWFREIDLACDRFLVGRGLPLTQGGFRDLIHLDCREKQAAKNQKAA